MAPDEHCDEDTHDELTTTLYRSTSQSQSHMTSRKGVIIVTSLSPTMPKRSRTQLTAYEVNGITSRH